MMRVTKTTPTGRPSTVVRGLTVRQMETLEQAVGTMIDRLTSARDRLSDDDRLRNDLANALDGLHQADATLLDLIRRPVGERS
jgi:hypothetical protein